MELAAESGIRVAAAPVRTIKRTQDTLGRLHDLQVLQGYVSAAQAEPASRTPPDGGLEIIARLLEDECRHLHARYVSGVPAMHHVIEITRTAVVPQLAHARRRHLRSLKMSLDSPARSKDAVRPIPASGQGK
jgi:CHAD domain-containing protein